MNCPSCNFKNIEENRFCIMCGTPLEGGGARSDTTGSLDLSASLPGAADIDFSGLMDQVKGDGGDGLFDPGELDAGKKADAGGSLDLMLSDFEGNLASLGKPPAAGGAPQKEGLPPPSGGEGWGKDAPPAPSDDFSFSDLSDLDPAKSGDRVGPKPAPAPGADDPLDFSFSEDKMPGGKGARPTTGLAPKVPAGPGKPAPTGPKGGTSSIPRVPTGVAPKIPPGPAKVPARPPAGPGKPAPGIDDSMTELERFGTMPKPNAGGAKAGGEDDLEDLLKEIEDLPPAKGGRKPQPEEATVEISTDAEATEAFGALFQGGPAPGPQGKPKPAPKPKADEMMASGLIFEEPPPGRPPARPQPADESVSGMDDLLASASGNAPAKPAPKAAAAAGPKAAPKKKGGDDLDDFLAELETETGKGKAGPEVVEAVDLGDLLPADEPPSRAKAKPAPGKGPARPAPKPAAKAADEAVDELAFGAEEPPPAPAKPKPKAAKKPPAEDASDDEIARMIAGLEGPGEALPKASTPAAEQLDEGEEAPPTGSALDEFLDEITAGSAPPLALAAGERQPLGVPTAITPVPGRVEEIDPKTLIKQLEGARDENRRYQIVQRLAQLHHPETFETFLRLLADPNSDIRECAAEALGNLGNPDAVRPLLKSLSTERGNLRYLCVEALGKLASTQATRPLIALLSETDENMGYVAAEALGRIGDPEAVRPLMAMANSADKDLRYIVAKSLGAIGSIEATGVLLQLLQDPDREVRAEAIRSLGELADPEGAGALLDFLDEESDPDLTLEAVCALGRMKSRAALRHLLGLLKTQREELAVEVIRALGAMRAPEAVRPIITRMQDDEGREVQLAAVRALGDLGDGAAVPALVQLLQGGRDGHKVPIAEALAKIKVPEALAPLEELLQDADVVVRSHAVAGIGSQQNPASVSHLERVVKDPDEGVRRSAANALGAIGTEETLPLLMQLLSDPAKEVCDAAAKALETLGTPAVPLLVGSLESGAGDPEQVGRLVRVLGAIGDIRGINPLLEIFEEADRPTRERIAESLVAIDRKLAGTGRVSTLMKEGYAWLRFRIASTLGREALPAAGELLLEIIESTQTDEDLARLKNFPDSGIVQVARESLAGVRTAAAELLGALNLPDTVKMILARMQKADGENRRWLVRCLGFVQKDASVAALIELVKKEDSGLSASFLGKVLKRIPLPSTVDRTLSALASASATVRARAAEVLGILGDVRGVGKLSELTRDADEEVRLAALGSLERIGSNQAFDALGRAVKDVSPAVRRRAVEALLHLPDDRAITVLGTALQDRVAEVRGAAAKALGSIKDKRVVPILLAGLKDESSEVRLSIVNTLGALGDRGAVKPVIGVLQDISSEVRQAAVRALGKMHDAEVVWPLLKSMGDHDLWVKTEARKTLLALGEPMLARKIDALGSDDEAMQQAAVAVLAEERSPRLYGQLLDAFGHRSKSMRANAARVLGLLKETKAVVPLIHLLEDRDYEVREKAAVALGEIGDISASVALKHAQKDQNKDVRIAAAQALKRIMELAAVG